jgi:formiminoglutamate deiminase
MSMRVSGRWFARRAWLGEAQGVEEDVLIETADGRIAEIATGAAPASDANVLEGLVLPGLANVHSHAFHRALRGRTERATGDFWSWRDLMYRIAGAIDPDTYFELARATYAEMALAGVAAVGEFHYLHHGPGGRPYADPNEMGRALVAAAREAGLRITLLDTCYLRGGFDAPLQGAQIRFGDGSAVAWRERVAGLEEGPGVRVGAAVHSVRALDEPDIATVVAWAGERRAPLHVHLSEQRAENRACLEATRLTPTRLLERAGALGPATCAVHATHLEAEDVRLLGERGVTACLCPTTERDLADGVGPARELTDAGARLCLGSDSHAVIDLFEEARAVELDERLVSERRGHHRPERLLAAATGAGMAALGWDGGRLAPGALADLVAVDLRSPRMAGAAGDPVGQLVFAATAADVTDLVVGGEWVVRDRRHVRVGDVGEALERALARTHAAAG